MVTNTQDGIDEFIASEIDVLDPHSLSKSYGELPTEDDIKKELTEELLLPRNELTWDILDLVQEIPKYDTHRFYNDLFHMPKPISRSFVRFKRAGIDGTIDTYKEEIKISDIDNANSGNSLSMQRRFTSKGSSLRGNTNFLPFQPGGLLEQTKKQGGIQKEKSLLHRNDLGLFDIPQGFRRGLKIDGEDTTNEENFVSLEDTEVESEEFEQEKESEENFSLSMPSNSTSNKVTQDDEIQEIGDLVPMDFITMKSSMNNVKQRHNWAHIVELDHKMDNFSDLVPKMARTWPFELDVFQKEAVYHLEQGDSVFVAAHTSAGKTVVAEYAIAMAARNMTKTIYTSPIKALSNQKFRDFKTTFKDVDVGLITGDVQINPEASCLIMTTEVLRSMLYRGADLIRDVEFVIFDEVHYVNDIDRGVVWEEVIIMLPDHIKYILLSATVPNTFEFANWVGRTKQKDIYVITTTKRPVPLEINIWAKNSLYKVVDAERRFSEVEFKKHKDVLSGTDKKPPNVHMGAGSRGGMGGSTRGGNRANTTANRGRGGANNKVGNRVNLARDGPNKNTWITLVQYLKGNNLLPGVVFVFSKKRCEEYADTLQSVDFCSAKEKSEIHMTIERAVSRLKKEDSELPQIMKIREMLSRGIAVHHGGLLPIVKEVIEILFSKTLVKVLFATETFAMGLNLPTRTVVFDKLRKHDGKGFRNLVPGEFTQMSGRAGRRGLDSTGTVIVMAYNQPLMQSDFKEVTLGQSTKLQSQFRLTYNMILNLLRIEALRVEEMIKHSFSENSTQTLLPESQREIEKLNTELKELKVSDCSKCHLEKMPIIFQTILEYEKAYASIVEEIETSQSVRNHILKIGRSLVFKNEDSDLRLGFLVRSDSPSKSLLVLTFNHGKLFEEEISTLKIPYIPNRSFLKKFLPRIKYEGDLRITAVPYEQVNFIGRYSLKARIHSILENDKDAIRDAEEQIAFMLKFQNNWDEVSFSQITQLSLHESLQKKRSLMEDFKSFTFCTDFKEHYSEFLHNHKIQERINSLQKLLSDENLELLPDYIQRLQVLESLNFIDENSNVVLKGRVACEINSGWELVITELVLSNFLGDFDPEEIVALLSCFVYEGRTNEEEAPLVTPRLEKGKARINEISENLLKVYVEHQVSLTAEEEEFTQRKRFALTNVVYEWARGLSFNEIMRMSVEAEGTIVRVITRLDEICREVKNAALIIGDSTLHSKMSDAQEKIKRDIVFCASLYL